MNLFKKMIRFSFMLLMTLAVLTSCNKDNELEKEIDNNNTTVGVVDTVSNDQPTVSATRSMMTADSDSLCFEFLFPVTFQLPNGSFIRMENEAAWSQ